MLIMQDKQTVGKAEGTENQSELLTKLSEKAY